MENPFNASTRYINTPIVFVGGVPRSGTTLMRVMLGSHAHVRCGPETYIIASLLEKRAEWLRLEILAAAGITENMLDFAVASFIDAIVTRHGRAARRLCNKDPFSLKHISFLANIFPRSKFVLMLRDGRASAYSMALRRLKDGGCDCGRGLEDYRLCLRCWNEVVRQMYDECKLVGASRCRAVKYEKLVLEPEKEMRALLDFLDLPWDDAVMHHEEHIGKRVSVSRVVWSTPQVMKPINTDGLSNGFEKLPAAVLRDAATIAPMLAVLGYDINITGVRYATPETLVVRNTQKIHQGVVLVNK